MSWPVVRLADCCEIVSGATPSTGVRRYWGGDIAWATPKDLSGLESKYLERTPQTLTQEGYESCSAKIMPPNSVLFSSRAPIGHVAINTAPMCTNQGFKSFVPDAERLSADFLYYWLRANKVYLQSLGVGATFKEVSKSIVADVGLPLPPLPEQRRIAAILDKADALRTQRRAAISKLDELLQSVFLDMFGDVTKNPKNFPVVTLEEISEKSDRINYGVVQPGSEFDNGIPIVRIGDIEGGELDASSIKHIDPEIEAAYIRSRLKGNEILISCVGSIGTVAIVPELARGFNIARAITRVPLKNPESRAFVKASLRSSGTQNYFREKTRTVSQPTLNVEFVRQTPVLSPPNELQQRFTRVAEEVEVRRSEMLASVVKLDTLFASLQHRAFAGTL